MAKRKMALRLATLRDPPREAMARAAALQMEAVVPHCARGELSPQELDRTGRDHLRHYLGDLNLRLAAIEGDTGFRFDDDNRIEWFQELTAELLDLALDLGAPVVQLAVGTVPESVESPRYGTMMEILTDLGNEAADRDIRLAISAGFEPPEILRGFLDQAANDGLGVTYDPANFVFAQADPVGAIQCLAKHIVIVRARDGRRYLDGSSEELGMGNGDVPYDAVIEGLDDADYAGYFILAREPCDHVEQEIEAARRFLERY